MPGGLSVGYEAVAVARAFGGLAAEGGEATVPAGCIFGSGDGDDGECEEDAGYEECDRSFRHGLRIPLVERKSDALVL